jgi:hypothetical protein
MHRQLGKIAIDLAMVAKGKADPGQFRPLTATRVDEVESGFA